MGVSRRGHFQEAEVEFPTGKGIGGISGLDIFYEGRDIEFGDGGIDEGCQIGRDRT